jgi:hypothetical protein
MLGIVNGEIVKVTDESVQKEIDINTEVLGIVNGEIVPSAVCTVVFVFVGNSFRIGTFEKKKGSDRILTGEPVSTG